MSKQLVIYLDIDGVLNSGVFYSNEIVAPSREGNGKETFQNIMKDLAERDVIRRFAKNPNGDWVQTSMLKKLHGFVKKYDAKVIVVSAWVTFAGDAQSVKELFEMPEIDVTETYEYLDTKGSDRGEKVFNHSTRNGYENVMVVDDSWKQMYDGYWDLCIRDFRHGEGLTDKTIQMMERFVEQQCTLN